MRTSLDGLRVLDLSRSVTGNYCSKLLGLNGARVWMIKPPEESSTADGGGDPDRVHPDQFLDRHLNEGKTVISLDAGAGSQRSVAVDRASELDVVIYDEASEAELGGLAEQFPHLVTLCVREFPQTASFEGWTASEMIHQALSGCMYVTGRGGEKPIYGLGHRASYAAGVTAYSSVLAALFHRGSAGGQGQRVEISVLEAAAAMGQNLISQYSYNGTFPERARYPGMLSMLRCRDSWVVMFALRNWGAICDVFELQELAEDPRFAESGARSRNWPIASALISERASSYLADDLVRMGQARKISMEKVHTVGDVLNSPQVQARGFILGEGSDIALAAPFRRFGEKPSRLGAQDDTKESSSVHGGAANGSDDSRTGDGMVAARGGQST